MLDILLIPMSSVLCKQLFSQAKEVSIDKCSRLGADIFEALQCLYYHWQDTIVDFAHLNLLKVKELDMAEFKLMAQVEEELYSDSFSELEDVV
ncbi:hypothetical protein B0H21DRAFT_853283, partial [Amylocystis lapponica]